jgi:proteasome lid subunit RPN8/RPN11
MSLELRKRDGTPLGQVPVAADWEPALEAARFSALRRFQIDAIGADAVAEFKPAWHETLGEPYVGATEVVLQLPGIGDLSCRVPNSYFKSLASAASTPYVENGALKAAEHFDYFVTAFPSPPPRTTAPERERFTIQEVATPLPIKSSLLDEFYARSYECGVSDGQDIPVFIPQKVLDEAEELTRRSPAVEVAAVLIGHAHRDRAGGDLFLEVTAQIPARNPQGTATAVTFGPETWTAVRAAMALRDGHEQMVGWFHSHPASTWCNAKCPPEARAKCLLQRTFFSADDCAVHRTVFSKAFCIALLLTNTDTGLQRAVFSWRHGVIVQRAFHIIGDPETQNSAAQPAVATIGDAEHENKCP